MRRRGRKCRMKGVAAVNKPEVYSGTLASKAGERSPTVSYADARKGFFVISSSANDEAFAAEALLEISKDLLKALASRYPEHLPPRDEVAEVFSRLEAHVQEMSNAGCFDSPPYLALGVLFLREGKYLICHVGNTRTYLCRNYMLLQLTRDHSRSFELYRKGRLRKDEVASHPSSSSLTRGMGAGLECRPDFHEGAVRPGDIFLMCNNELAAALSDDVLVELLSDPRPLHETGTAMSTAAYGFARPVHFLLMRIGEDSAEHGGHAESDLQQEDPRASCSGPPPKPPEASRQAPAAEVESPPGTESEEREEEGSGVDDISREIEDEIEEMRTTFRGMLSFEDVPVEISMDGDDGSEVSAGEEGESAAVPGSGAPGEVEAAPPREASSAKEEETGEPPHSANRRKEKRKDDRQKMVRITVRRIWGPSVKILMEEGGERPQDFVEEHPVLTLALSLAAVVLAYILFFVRL